MLYQIFDHIDECCSEAAIQQMLPRVSAQRAEAAMRYKHLFGQFVCLKSYLMLQELLGAVSPTLDYTCPDFCFNEHGKPSLVTDCGWHFNISHTKNAILVAIAQQPVGVDIERFRQPSEGLIEKTMSEMEQQRLKVVREHSPQLLAQEFTALWTRKEAVLKLRGTGITDDLHHVLEGTEKVTTLLSPSQAYAYSFAQKE